MPRLAQSVPKYRLHKSSRQAFVELNDRRHYLGPHGTKASRLEYDRLIGEWLQNGRTTRPSDDGGSGSLLVVELIVAYLNFAKGYYRKSGRLTTEYTAILHSVRQLKLLYGRKCVREFGPIALQTVMARMIDDGWARTTVNRQPIANCSCRKLSETVHNCRQMRVIASVRTPEVRVLESGGPWRSITRPKWPTHC